MKVFQVNNKQQQQAPYTIVELTGIDAANANTPAPACGGLALRPCSNEESPSPCSQELVVNYTMKKGMRSSLEKIKQPTAPLAPVYLVLQPGNPQHEKLLARRVTLDIVNPEGNHFARVSAKG